MTMSRRTWLSAAAAMVTHATVSAQTHTRSIPPGAADEHGLGSRVGPKGARPEWPRWRRAMAAQTWAPIGNSTLAAINPAHSPAYNLDYPDAPVWQRREHGGVTSDQAVIAPWCGAVWDEDGGNFWLPLGGGHGDYGGNESYKICLYDDYPTWTMPKPPSGSKQYIDAEGIPSGATRLGKSYLLDDHKEASGVYADGRPRATHSYNKAIYAPGVGPVMVKLGGTFVDVTDSSKWTWRYDEAANEWQFKVTPTDIHWPGLTDGAAACYDPARHCAYWLGHGGATLCRVDLKTWQWSQLTSSHVYHGGSLKLINLPGQDKVLEINLTEMAVWNCATGARTVISTTGSGATPVNAQFGEYGWDWCPTLGCVVCWPGHAGTTATLYTLTPGRNLLTDPWKWEALTVAGGTPPAATAQGTYGRFAYSSRLNGFMMLNSRSDPVWFFALE